LGPVEVAEYPELAKVTAQSRQPSHTGDALFVIHDIAADQDGPET
jgi:hypothetical protein